MTQVAASPNTLLPARRSVRSPWTGITPRPLRLLGSGLGWASNLVAGFALLMFLGLAVGPHLLGYRTETMLTGSMAPNINVGDVVVAMKTPAANLRVGDVISYRIPVDDQRVVSHRVVEITNNPDGSTAVRTKGDANEVADPWVARIDGRQVWKVRFTVPAIGTVIRWLRQPEIARALRFGAPALVIMLALAGIWQRPPAPHPRNSPHGHHNQHARHAQDHR